MYILAIDQGTTSSRAILYDKAGEAIASAQKEIENIFPHPGWVEQDAKEIWSSVIGVMNEVLASSNINASSIAGIGITNQRETTIIWDKRTGQPIYPAIVWQSNQSEELCKERSEYEAYIKEKTGLTLSPYFSASKIRFILDETNMQEEAEKGNLLFGTVDSWLVWKLCGEHITDVSNACRTMLMDLDTCAYDEGLLSIWNIPSVMLPSIKETSEVYGTYTLDGHKVPIACVVGDQQASLFGQCCFEKGDVKNTYGTGCFLLMNTKDRVVSKHGLISSAGWRINNQTTYVLEGSIFVGGAAISWLRDGVNMIRSSDESEMRAMQVDSSEGVYVIPAFSGLGAPYWKSDVKGAIFGLTRASSQEHIIRATLESLAYQTNDILRAMEEDVQQQLSSLKVDGGASKNRYLLQFQSDILGIVVEHSRMVENTSKGCAYLCGLAVGYWRDIEEIRNLEDARDQYHPSMNKIKQQECIRGWQHYIRKLITE